MSGDLTEQEALALRGINAAMDLAHETATNAGWYRDPATGAPKQRNFGEVLMLMVSELAEALEANRKGLMDDKLPDRPGEEVELADCIIRIFDTARANGYDLAGALIAKNRFNRERSDHKLENRAAAGGKRY
jgi:NTP pyrophosphatase (non-canonical NTP hydrolase)